MGRGKKKDKSQKATSEASLPAIEHLSLSEASTSQLPSVSLATGEEDRKKQESKKEEKQPQVSQPKPEEEKEEECEGLGLGLGASKNKRKKKTAAQKAAAAEKESVGEKGAAASDQGQTAEHPVQVGAVGGAIQIRRDQTVIAGQQPQQSRWQPPSQQQDYPASGRERSWRNEQPGPTRPQSGQPSSQVPSFSACSAEPRSQWQDQPAAGRGRSRRNVQVGPTDPQSGRPQDSQSYSGQSRNQWQDKTMAAGRGRGRGNILAGSSGPPGYSCASQATSESQSQGDQPKSAPTIRSSVPCLYKIPHAIRGRSVRATPVKVITNYLPMRFKPIKVYRYDVTIVPERPKKMLPDVFKLFKTKHYPNDFLAFDQVKNCYALQALKNIPNDGSRFAGNVEIKDSNGRVMSFEVSVKMTGVVDFQNIKQHMETGGSSLHTPMEEIQCIDVILRQGALESYVKSGRQFFKRPQNPINLSGGLEMWTGLFQSAIFTSHAFINVDVAHKGFPIQQSMISLMTNSFRIALDRPLEEQRGRDIEYFTSLVRGLRVVARMIDGQTREFICNGLVDPPHKLFFDTERDNRRIRMSVAEYFSKEKNYRLKYPYVNCMWVGPRDKKIYYPLELLDVSYGQVMNRQLNDMQLSTMVREAATPPDIRKKKIEEVARHMNYSNNPFFKKFGLEISDQFLEVDAKVLAPPMLNVGEGRPLMPRRGVWQANRLQKPEALRSWGFIAIDCDARASNFETIKSLLLQTGPPLGMAVAEPQLTKFNVRMNELRNVLFTALEKDVKLLFIIVCTRGRDIYHKVKQMAERDVGILTQCIKEFTATRKMSGPTMKNILLKVNSKLMGINQVLDACATPQCIKRGDAMIVGADVTHPSPEQTSIPSIAAVTASMDPNCYSYNIELSIQTPKKEVIVEFEDLLFDHLMMYRKRNNALPNKIYVFRDGVSEGQFSQVMNSELSAVHKAYQRLDRNRKPEVLFLLVQKRHHTRFFLGKNSANVEPGTVVDTHIVHPKELDFYLVSHQAIKGTARPTRYHAVCNDGNIPNDEVEQLTYYLCHVYSRCMRAVSYPTPTYYAHLACLRARSLTHGEMFDNKKLERKPERLRVLDKMLQFSHMFFV